MNSNEISDIYKAINEVSKKVNNVAQTLDNFIQSINNDCNNKISISGHGIDDLAEIVASHDESIKELKTIVSKLEGAK